MKKGDVVYIVDGALYAYTTTGSWGYLLRVDGEHGEAYVDWQHLTGTSYGDTEYMLTSKRPDGTPTHHTWDIDPEVLRALENPPEDHDTITQLVGVLARLEGD